MDYEVMLVLPINSKLNTSLNNITEELVTAVKAAAESEGQNCHIQNSESGGMAQGLGKARAVGGERFHLVPLAIRWKTLTLGVTQML